MKTQNTVSNTLIVSLWGRKIVYSVISLIVLTTLPVFRKSSDIPSRSPPPKGQQRQDQDIILLQILAGGQVGRKVSLCPQAGRLTFSALPYCSVSPLKGLLSPNSPVIVTLLSFPFYCPLQKRQIRTRRRCKWEILQSQFSAWHA